MTETNNQFIVSLPDGWSDTTAYIFQGPDDSGVQHTLSLTIDRDAATDSVEEYARERIDTVMETLQSAEVLKDEEVTVGTHKAYECVIKWIPSNDRIIFRKMVFVIVDGVGYSFAANFSKKTIKTIGVEVEKIIASLTAPIKTE